MAQRYIPGSGFIDETDTAQRFVSGFGFVSGTGTGGSGTGGFLTDIMENNTGAGVLSSVSVTWTWFQGSIGAAFASITHGVTTTSVGGTLTLTGLPLGAGFLLAKTADGAGVYYQTGTVT